MTDQRRVETRFETEAGTRLEAARQHLANGAADALRLEVHRWRVALKAAGRFSPDALLRFERLLEIDGSVGQAFGLESVAAEISADPPSIAHHRRQRAARAAGRAVPLEPVALNPVPLNPVPLNPVPLNRVPLESSRVSGALWTRAADDLSGQPSASSGAAPPPALETVRVPVAKLDALLALSGELRVAQIRATTRTAQLKTLLSAMNSERRQWRKRAAEPPLLLLERFRQRTREALKKFGALERQLALDNAQLQTLTQAIEDEVLGARLLPAAMLLPPLERLVRDLSQQLGKRVHLASSGADVELDRNIIDGLRDPLMHLVRNALDHGFEIPQLRAERGKPLEGSLRLQVASDGATVTIRLIDDGAGIDAAAVQRRAVTKGFVDSTQPLTDARISELIFEPGFSTAATVTETSGRGVGMDVVRENIAQLGGQIMLQSTAGLGCTFTLRLPVQLATSRVLLVRLSAAQLVALPTRDLERTGRIRPAQITAVASAHCVQVDGQALALASLGGLLGLTAQPVGQWLEYVILNAGNGQRLACAVAALVSEQEVVVKRLSYPLQAAAHLSGAALLGSGELVPILNVAAIIERHQQGGASQLFAQRPPTTPSTQSKRRRILVVDDSVTTRTLERSILESAGFETRTAMDGRQALELLRSFSAELVLSDIEMPHLDGFGLTLEIRRDPRTQHIPVILVTSLDKPEHKERGAQAGADAYIVKGEFNQQTLLETIGRLL